MNKSKSPSGALSTAMLHETQEQLTIVNVNDPNPVAKLNDYHEFNEFWDDVNPVQWSASGFEYGSSLQIPLFFSYGED